MTKPVDVIPAYISPPSSTPAERYERAERALAGNPHERMGYRERVRLRAAALRAQTVYPGPIGELIYRDLMAWDEFGFRLGAHSLIAQVIAQILPAPTA